MKTIQKRYNDKMEFAKKNIFTRVDSHKSDFTEALAKNEALAWISSQAQLMTVWQQKFFRRCMAKVKLINDQLITKEKVNAYLEIRALEWGFYPDPRTDYKGPF